MNDNNKGRHYIQNRYDLKRTIEIFKRADTEEALEERMKEAEALGVAYTKRAYYDANWEIEDATKDIEHFEKQLVEARRKLAKAEKEKELLEKLEATNFQDILNQMKEDRLQELATIEYEYVYKVMKASRNNGWHNSSVVIVCDMWMVEKNNPDNATMLREVFVLDWQDRGQLAEKLKEAGATKLAVDPKILTKKLEKEFEITGTGERRWALY